MANKRTLKKLINQICVELFKECYAMSLYGPANSKANATTLLFSIVKMQAHYLSRISHPEPGMKPKAYYDDLWEKFTAQAVEIEEQILA